MLSFLRRAVTPLFKNVVTKFLYTRPLSILSRRNDASNLPTRSTVSTGIMTFFRTFKIKTSVRLRCQHCYFARRDGTLFVRCKVAPRHKQRQGRATRKQGVFK